MKTARTAAAGCFFALIVVLAVTPGSWTYYRFVTDRYDFDGETAEVMSSLKLFSATIAGFYMTGGSTEGLNVFPAEKMIKRRIFMDLSSLNISEKILVTDRDRTYYREITFLSPIHAVVVADEEWYFAYQNAVTRRPLSTKKLNALTVRYYMKKTWGKWLVLEYDVFSRDDELPPYSVEKIVRW